MAGGADMNMKEAIERMLDTYNIRTKFDQTGLLAAWPEIIGPGIANRTKQLYIRERTLYVRVESAVVKNELVMMRSQIVSRLNEHAGHEVIDDIVLL